MSAKVPSVGRPARKAGIAAGWALLATLYWIAMAVFYVVTELSVIAVLAGAGAFVLLCWAIRDGAARRPSAASYLLAILSALYTLGAILTFGMAAYIEGHGCALQPETCSGGGLGLARTIAIGVTLLYFGLAWLVNRRRSHAPAGG